MHKVIKAGAAALAALVMVVMTAPPSQSHFLGGRWGGTSYGYTVNLNGHARFDGPIADAGRVWTNRTVFTVSRVSAQSATVWGSVSASYYDWIGLGVPGPNPEYGKYTYGNFYISSVWLNHRHFNCANPGAAACDYPKDSDSQLECVASHEMGHVMGLAHTEATIGYKAIMHPNHGTRCHAWAIIGSQAHDTGDIAALY